MKIKEKKQTYQFDLNSIKETFIRDAATDYRLRT
jgi:hypothetical protein